MVEGEAVRRGHSLNVFRRLWPTGFAHGLDEGWGVRERESRMAARILNSITGREELSLTEMGKTTGIEGPAEKTQMSTGCLRKDAKTVGCKSLQLKTCHRWRYVFRVD